MCTCGGTGAAFETIATHSVRFSLCVRNRERRQGHSNEMNIPVTPLINPEVPRKQNVRNSRLDAMETSNVLCIGMCDRPLCAISVCGQLLLDYVE